MPAFDETNKEKKNWKMKLRERWWILLLEVLKPQTLPNRSCPRKQNSLEMVHTEYHAFGLGNCITTCTCCFAKITFFNGLKSNYTFKLYRRLGVEFSRLNVKTKIRHEFHKKWLFGVCNNNARTNNIRTFGNKIVENFPSFFDF